MDGRSAQSRTRMCVINRDLTDATWNGTALTCALLRMLGYSIECSHVMA